jgi:hypothetical protein
MVCLLAQKEALQKSIKRANEILAQNAKQKKK